MPVEVGDTELRAGLSDVPLADCRAPRLAAAGWSARVGR